MSEQLITIKHAEMSPCMRYAQTALVSHVCCHDSQFVRQIVDPTDIWELTGI